MRQFPSLALTAPLFRDDIFPTHRHLTTRRCRYDHDVILWYGFSAPIRQFLMQVLADRHLQFPISKIPLINTTPDILPYSGIYLTKQSLFRFASNPFSGLQYYILPIEVFTSAGQN